MIEDLQAMVKVSELDRFSPCVANKYLFLACIDHVHVIPGEEGEGGIGFHSAQEAHFLPGCVFPCSAVPKVVRG